MRVDIFDELKQFWKWAVKLSKRFDIKVCDGEAGLAFGHVFPINLEVSMLPSPEAFLRCSQKASLPRTRKFQEIY